MDAAGTETCNVGSLKLGFRGLGFRVQSQNASRQVLLIHEHQRQAMNASCISRAVVVPELA